MKNKLYKLFLISLTICIHSSCSLGIDLGGFFYSYSSPDYRFSMKDSLAMHSSAAPLATPPSSMGNLQYSFTVISDVHVTDHTVSHLEDFVSSALQPQDLFIIDCGDSSQNGEAHQLQRFRDLLDSSSRPWFSAIGNHDLYFKGWKNYSSIIGKSVYTFDVGGVGENGSLLAIALDSANGTLGSRQLNWLESVLRSESGIRDHVIVFTHSQFFSTGISTVVQFTDREEIYQLMYLFKTYGVDIVFMGHNHNWDDRTIDGVRYITLNTLQKKDGKSCYARVFIDGNNLNIEKLSF